LPAGKVHSDQTRHGPSSLRRAATGGCELVHSHTRCRRRVAPITVRAGLSCSTPLALADALIIRVAASDEGLLAKLEEVVGRHLERFAFREELKVRWTRVASPSAAQLS
jgi:hypothetical protein